MDVSDSKKLKEWYEIVPNPLDQTDEQQVANQTRKIMPSALALDKIALIVRQARQTR